jgi:GNAT superfamily N-acetyltransferase
MEGDLSEQLERDATAAGSRARAWRNRAHAAVCDTIEPWAYGTVVRATRYRRYFDFNAVRVEEETGMSVEELASFAEEALAGLDHRRIDFDCLAAGEARRAAFVAKGWRALRLLWMRHEHPPGLEPDPRVAIVPCEAAQPLRERWHEDFGDATPEEYHAQAREVALMRGVQTLAIREGSEPVAFAQLERDGPGTEITQVYVHPEHRGGGLGTAITHGAIELAGSAGDLWICADDEERAKELYTRLGFEPVWTTMNFLLRPEDVAAG